MQNPLTFHLRRLDARLHRMRIALHTRGCQGLLQRVTRRNEQSSPVIERAGSPPAKHRDTSTSGGLRILLIDVTTPRPDRDSGSVRAFNLMRLLGDEGHQVDFLPDDRIDAGAYTDALRAIGVEVHCGRSMPGYRNWFHRHLTDYDALVISRYHLGEFLIPLARAVSPRTRIVLDTVDLHFLREQREADLRGDRTLERLSRSTRRRELDAITTADVAWVVSQAERDLLQELRPDAPVHVLPNIIEGAAAEVTPRGRSGLLFVGGSRHPPNVDAIDWMIGDILPRLDAHVPGCVLHIVGEGTREVVGGRAGRNVVAHGHVEDLAPLLSGCRAGIAPLRFGAGVKGKVNLYMAHGLPSIVSSCAAEGMHLRPGEDALLADDADAFAEAIARVCNDDVLWRALSRNGRTSVQRHFSFDIARDAVATTFAPDR